MSYVSIRTSGRVFEMWGMPFQKWWKTAVVSYDEIISAGQGNEDLYNRESFSVKREGWLGVRDARQCFGRR